MTEQDQQIADKIIAKLALPDGWAWIPKAHGCNGWIEKDRLLIKAFHRIGPADPWEYVSVYVGYSTLSELEWKIPNELRKPIWEKAWPIFESVRSKEAEKEKSSILEWL